MEIKAYIEGITRKWWLLLMVALLSWWSGGQVAATLPATYTASTFILLNDKLLGDSAFPSGTVQLDIPDDYAGQVLSPAVMYRIIHTYRRFTIPQLQHAVGVTTDQTKQVLLINVTTTTPGIAADIANFLAQNFVQAQTTNINRQVEYYKQWMQGNVTHLNDEINQLNQQITKITPQKPLRGALPPLTPSQRITINQYQTQVNQDRHTLYTDQQALIEIQHAISLIPETYRILKTADLPTDPDTAPLPPGVIQLLTVAAGLLAILCLLIGFDFFTPLIRHKGEISTITGQPVLAELPRPSLFEQRLLLAPPTRRSSLLPFLNRTRALRQLCAVLSAIALKTKGYTILLIGLQHPSRYSLWRKGTFTTLLATFLARKGLKVLLVDTDFAQPSLHEQIQVTGPYSLPPPGKTESRQIPLMHTTTQTNLFFLPATTLLAGQHLTGTTLLEYLPHFQQAFDLIILNGQSLDHPDIHLLATRVNRVLLLLKKRRDSIQKLKIARRVCDILLIEPYCLLLS